MDKIRTELLKVYPKDVANKLQWFFLMKGKVNHFWRSNEEECDNSNERGILIFVFLSILVKILIIQIILKIIKKELERKILVKTNHVGFREKI